MCQVFGRSKQAYYKLLHQNANAAVKEEVIVGLIKKKREIWKRGSGRNLHQCLQKEFKTHDIKMGRDKFFDLLRNNHLLIKTLQNENNLQLSSFQQIQKFNRVHYPITFQRNMGIGYHLPVVKAPGQILLPEHYH